MNLHLTRTAAIALSFAVAANAAAQDHARLLFAKQSEEHCDVGTWDARSSSTTNLARIGECPESLFVSEDGSEVFVVDGDRLLLIPLGNPESRTSVPLPDLSWRSWLDQMDLRPDINPNYLPSLDDMKPILAGKLDDGALGFAASVWMPADDEFHYVFRYDGDTWTIIGNRACGRWGCEDPLPMLDGQTTDLWTWPEERRVWHENMAANPNVTSREIDPENGEHTLTFEVGGESSTLRAYVGPSAHFDLVYTFALELRVGDGPFVNLSKNQCLTSVVGRHVLVAEFFQGRFEITDLGTGETMISDLAAAMWLD